MRNTHTGKGTLPVLSNVGDLENIGIIVRGCESAVVGSVWRVRVSAIWLDVCNQIPSSLHLPDDPFLARLLEILLMCLKNGFVYLLIQFLRTHLRKRVTIYW